MGQSSIPTLNKVGYSMFWNSMWDSEVSYSRNLKEDLFFNKFFSLIFNDNVSTNIISFKKNKKYLFKAYNMKIDEKNNSLYKYLINNNKMKFTPSKIWILKYQKWIIFYKFIFINSFEKKERRIKQVRKLAYGDNFFYFYKFYKKSSLNLNYNYFLYKNFVKNNAF